MSYRIGGRKESRIPDIGYHKEKMRVKHYIRYMDDGILRHESKEFLNEVRVEMEKMVAELKVEFNEKTQIFPIAEGVDFLGFRFYLTDTGKVVVKRLRTSNKRRWKRRLKKFKEAYRNDEKSLAEISRSMASYNGHLKHGHTFRLRKKVLAGFVLTKAKKEDGCNGNP